MCSRVQARRFAGQCAVRTDRVNCHHRHTVHPDERSRRVIDCSPRPKRRSRGRRKEAYYDAEPQAAPPPAAPAEPDMASQLKELAQLKEQGILTEKEFQAKKKQILDL